MASNKRRRKVKQHQTRERQTRSLSGERDDSGPKEYTLRHRASKLAQIIATYPQQIALGLATREDAGWVFGRLYLVGAIDYDQKAAAERLSRAVATYRRLLHKLGPRVMRAVTTPEGPVFEGRSSPSREDLSPAAERQFEKAKKEYDRHLSILRACGEEVEYAVLRTLETDVLKDLSRIQTGLNALCALRSQRSVVVNKRAHSLSVSS